MPKLTLKFNNKVIKIYNFKKDKSIGIGRRENNDIVISNLTVSGHHAKIDLTDDGFLLTDLNSKNKSYVNGEEVTTCILQDKDEIGIGKHILVFSPAKDELPGGDKEDDMDRTMAMNTVSHKDLLKRNAGAGELNPGVAMLAFVEGGDGKIELKGNTVKIGKDPDSDIVIQGLFVGKTAAILKKTNQGYTLSFGGGFSKVHVNNKVVKHTVLLEEFDLIRIGSIELQFFYR